MIPPKRIMIAAWGSRGDLQPVTALALALKNVGGGSTRFCYTTSVTMKARIT